MGYSAVLLFLNSMWLCLSNETAYISGIAKLALGVL